MPKAITAWRDERGGIHETHEAALLSDIEHCLSDGQRASSNGASITPGLAKLVAEKAACLIPLLDEWKGLAGENGNG